MKITFFSILIICCCNLSAQTTITSSGANGTSSVGSESFSVGQIDYIQASSSSSDLRLGVLQTIEFNALLKTRVFLSNLDSTAGLMEDYIKTEMNFPMSDPYSVPGVHKDRYGHVKNSITAATSAPVLATAGNNSFVDWVFLELRSGSDASTAVL